jgi:hypothetical protein
MELYIPDSSRKLRHRIEPAKRLAFTAVLMASAACPMGSVANESIVLTNVEVVAHSPLPPYTGVVETWVVLTVRVKSTQQNLLVPYFSAAQYLPEVGDACDFTVHREAINGIAGNQVVSGTFTVVDHTQCHDAHS